MTIDSIELGHEPDRLVLLQRLALREAPAQEALARLTRMAAKVLRAPTAVVTLIDEHEGLVSTSTGPLSVERQELVAQAFATPVIASGVVLASRNARDHPIPNAPGVASLGRVACLGIPLLAGAGHSIGAMCVLDQQPRSWSDDDTEVLQSLAASTMNEIELRAAAREAEAAQMRLAFLDRVSRQLANSLDYETTLANVARLAVPALADYCAIHVLKATGQVQRIELAHADPAKEALLRELQSRYAPPNLHRRAGLATVLRTGKSKLYPDVSRAWSEVVGHGSARSRILEAVSPKSLIVVPLLARGRTLGAFSLASAESARRYDPSDLTLAEAIARRCALAIDNARLYQEVQLALRTREEFLAAVAHDLRTPLTAIKGWAQFLRRQASQTTPPTIASLIDGLARIDLTTTKMTGLIDELLDLARLEMGQPLPLERYPTDLVVLVRQVVSQLQVTTQLHTLRVAPATSEVVGLWDAPRLERLLDNLLSNAIKYSPDGGEIIVSVATESRGKTSWAVLQVRDHGLGIPAADLPQLFSRFHRGSNVSGSTAGAGLGLAKSRQIVEQHGGSITIESREGVGTTVSVRLPLFLQTLEADTPRR